MDLAGFLDGLVQLTPIWTSHHTQSNLDKVTICYESKTRLDFALGQCSHVEFKLGILPNLIWARQLITLGNRNLTGSLSINPPETCLDLI